MLNFHFLIHSLFQKESFMLNFYFLIWSLFLKKNIFYVIHSLSETFTFPKRNLSFASFLFDTYCIAAKIPLWQFLPTKNYKNDKNDKINRCVKRVCCKNSTSLYWCLHRFTNHRSLWFRSVQIDANRRYKYIYNHLPLLHRFTNHRSL